MRIYKRSRSRRGLKKYLRRREAELEFHLRRFLEGFDPSRPHGEGKNRELLLRLRWLIFAFIYVRLRFKPWWANRRRFLEHFDVDEVKASPRGVELRGDMVWWAEGRDAVGEWWPKDHEPRPTGVYKVKIRGDLDGGFWVLEPVRVTMTLCDSPRRGAGYEIEFGKGSTYMKIKNERVKNTKTVKSR